MSKITPALELLRAYTVTAGLVAALRFAHGAESAAAVLAYGALIVILLATQRARGPVTRVVADWLPLLALPVLYWAVPHSMVHGDGRTFDAVVQSWDRGLFGTDPARTMAGALPFTGLSEVLHAAYLSYYAMIYGPPLLMYLTGDLVAFRRTVLAFTVVTVVCFIGFMLFPVAGPRYEWGAPAGVPTGPLRSLSAAVLERGSSHGTAFPSSHMAIALAMSLSSMRWRRGFGVVVLGVTILLGVGAVYGGFHYAVDIVAGGVVGIVGWAIAGRWEGLEAAKAASA